MLWDLQLLTYLRFFETFTDNPHGVNDIKPKVIMTMALVSGDWLIVPKVNDKPERKQLNVREHYLLRKPISHA